MNDTPWTEALSKIGEVLWRGIVIESEVLFGVEVVEVSEELIEAMVGGKVLVMVTQVVLAELTRGVAMRLECRGDRRILGL